MIDVLDDGLSVLLDKSHESHQAIAREFLLSLSCRFFKIKILSIASSRKGKKHTEAIRQIL